MSLMGQHSILTYLILNTIYGKEMITYELESEEKKSRLSHLILVVHQGELVAEGYGNDHEIPTKHTSWSMGKSIISSLVGLQLDREIMVLDQKNLIPEWSDERSNISMTHKLQATNGLDWAEDYSGVSDATQILFLKPDVAAIAAEVIEIVSEERRIEK